MSAVRSWDLEQTVRFGDLVDSNEPTNAPTGHPLNALEALVAGSVKV